MIAQLKKENDAQTWGLRAAGLICAWLALYCCFAPIATSADLMGDVVSQIPCIGGMLESTLEGVVEMFLCVISCGFGCSFGLFVIALVWLSMRPVVGVPLMVGVVILMIVGIIATKKAER